MLIGTIGLIVIALLVGVIWLLIHSSRNPLCYKFVTGTRQAMKERRVGLNTAPSLSKLEVWRECSAWAEEMLIEVRSRASTYALEYERFCDDFNIPLASGGQVIPILEHVQRVIALLVCAIGLCGFEMAVAFILATDSFDLPWYLAGGLGCLLSILLTAIAHGVIAELAHSPSVSRLLALEGVKRWCWRATVVDVFLLIGFFFIVRSTEQVEVFDGIQLVVGVGTTLLLPITAALVLSIRAFYVHGVKIVDAVAQLRTLETDLGNFPGILRWPWIRPSNAATGVPAKLYHRSIFPLILSVMFFGSTASAQAAAGEFQIWIDRTESVKPEALERGFQSVLEHLPVVLRRYKPARVVIYGFTDSAVLAQTIGVFPIRYPPDPVCHSAQTVLRNRRNRAATECATTAKAAEVRLSGVISATTLSVQEAFPKASVRKPGCTNIGSVMYRLSMTPGFIAREVVRRGSTENSSSGAWVLTDGKSTCGSRFMPGEKINVTIVLIPPLAGKGEKTVDDLYREAEVALRQSFPGVHVVAPYQLTGDEF